MTTLTEVVRNPIVREKFKIPAGEVRKPRRLQIRNQGAIGSIAGRAAGAIATRMKCYRARARQHLLRRYARLPINREHAIIDADRCVAVSPSDSAPALIALDAKMVIRNKSGERVVNAEDYFIGPSLDITRMTVLKPGDLLVAIRIPSTWANAQFYFEKVRDRPVWDFPLVNIAAAAKYSGDNIQDIRIAVNGVAAHPVRLVNVENAVKGKPHNAETGDMAGKMAIEGAVALRHNGYKIPLMRNLVKRSIRGVEEPKWRA